MYTQCKRQLLPWRIYNLNKQASQSLRGRKCYCIFYILCYILGKREGRSHWKPLQSIHWSCWIRTHLPLQRHPVTEFRVEVDPVSVSEPLSLCPRIVPEPINLHLLILIWQPLDLSVFSIEPASTALSLHSLCSPPEETSGVLTTVFDAFFPLCTYRLMVNSPSGYTQQLASSRRGLWDTCAWVAVPWLCLGFCLPPCVWGGRGVLRAASHCIEQTNCFECHPFKSGPHFSVTPDEALFCQASAGIWRGLNAWNSRSVWKAKCLSWSLLIVILSPDIAVETWESNVSPVS